RILAAIRLPVDEGPRSQPASIRPGAGRRRPRFLDRHARRSDQRESKDGQRQKFRRPLHRSSFRAPRSTSVPISSPIGSPFSDMNITRPVTSLGPLTREQCVAEQPEVGQDEQYDRVYAAPFMRRSSPKVDKSPCMMGATVEKEEAAMTRHSAVPFLRGLWLVFAAALWARAASGQDTGLSSFENISVGPAERTEVSRLTDAGVLNIGDAGGMVITL